MFDRPGESRDATVPVLVTGSPRSGSTWVGNVLALAPGAGYIHEPFNRRRPPGLCRAPLTDFAYVTPETETPYLEAFRDTLAWRYSPSAEIGTVRGPRALARLTRNFAYFEMNRRRGARVILKDPLALFSADWIATRFGARVVVVIRHPAGFVASMRAAGWRVNFRTFQNQPKLIADRLAPFAEAIAGAAARPPDDPIAASALLWNILHHHIALLTAEHPEWIFVRHEDLSRDPAAGFEALFARLGLDFSEPVRADLRQFTTDQAALARLSLFGRARRTMRDSRASVHAFRQRLDAAEIAAVREATSPLWTRFYDDGDW